MARRPSPQSCLRRLGRPLAEGLWRLDLAGVERVPSAGPAILCANHISFLDSVVVLLAVDREVRFLGKQEYVDRWPSRQLFPAFGMIPVDRTDRTRAAAALDEMAGVLESGGVCAIFPEGTRSRSGELHRGRTGAARLALRTGAPLVPVGIAGTAEIQPPGSRVPRLLGRCSLRVGAPVEPTSLARLPGPLAARRLTDEVMQRIAALTGQRHVDRYAPLPSGPSRAEPPSARDSVRPARVPAAG